MNTFTGWLASIGLTLTPGQEALWRVFGDGELPRDTEIDRAIFGVGVARLSPTSSAWSTSSGSRSGRAAQTAS